MKRFAIVASVMLPGRFGSFALGVAMTTGEGSLAPPPPAVSLVPAAPVPLASVLPSLLVSPSPLLPLSAVSLADPLVGFLSAERAPIIALSLIMWTRRPAAVATRGFGRHFPLPFGEGPGAGSERHWSATSKAGANWFGSGPGANLFPFFCAAYFNRAAERGGTTTRRRAARSARTSASTDERPPLSGEPFGDGTDGQPCFGLGAERLVACQPSWANNK